jgi:hypothetical protein
MGFDQRLSRLEVRLREMEMLQLIREYPGFTVEELRNHLEFRRELQGKSPQEIEHYVVHGYWPENPNKETQHEPSIKGEVARDERQPL